MRQIPLLFSSHLLIFFQIFVLSIVTSGEEQEDNLVKIGSLKNGRQIRREEVTQGHNSSGSTVVIYKGPLPWAPLTRARVFGLKTTQLDEEEQRREPLSVQPTETISENNDGDGDDAGGEGSGEELPTEVLPSPDYVDQEEEEAKKENIRADLHESLRRPLKRLSDRQLSILLKQIRKQRRKQQQQQRVENEGNGQVEEGEKDQNRREMLGELRQLLREPMDGQKLIRPKLLTNINIVPNEWNIYPAKREGGGENDGRMREEGGGGGEKAKMGQEEHQSTSPTTQNGTNSDGQLTTTKGTPIELANETMAAVELARPGLLHAAAFAPLDNEVEGNELATDSAAENSTKRSEEENDEEKHQSEGKKTDDEKIAQLTANWRVIEQKLAAEMQNAVRTASQVLVEKEEKLEKGENGENKSNLSIEEWKQAKEKNNSTIIFSSKTWEPPSSSNSSSEAGGLLTSPEDTFELGSNHTMANLADLENAQLAELSAQLKQIRLRYESLKRQYLAKMRLLNERKLAGTKRLNKFKAAGAATFIDGAPELELKKNSDGENGTIVESAFKNDLNNQTNLSNEENEKKGEEIKVPEEFIQDEKKQARLEETRREEELARKVLSSEIDVEGDNHRENGTDQTQLKGISPTDAPEAVENGQTFAENATITIESSISRSNISTLAPTSTNKNGDDDEEEESALGNIQSGQNEKGKKKKAKEGGKKKSTTLAELAEELSKLDERMIGLVNANGTSNEGKTSIVQNSTKRPPKVASKSKKGNGQNNQTVATNLGGGHGKKKPAQKRKKTTKQQQGGLSGGGNTSLLSANSTTTIIASNATILGNSSTATNATSESSAAQLEEDFLQGAGLPSAPIRVIPTPRKRILTTDWLPKARIDLSTEFPETQESTQKLVGKQFDAGRKQGQGRRTISAGRQQNKQPGAKNVTISNGQNELLNSSAIHARPNGAHQKVAKRPRINQSAAIGTRPALQQRKPLAPAQQQQQNVQQQQKPTKIAANGQQQQQQNGFYQLDRAQIANVSPTPLKLPDLKLKGVSQVQVEASKDHREEPGELNDGQLQAKLREEMIAKKGNNNNNKTNNKSEKGKKKKEEIDDLTNLEEFARIDEQAICDAVACDFETGTLCEWVPSADELNPNDPRYKRYKMARRLLLFNKQRRHRRDAEKGGKIEEKPVKEDPQKAQKGKRFVIRTWHNWVGKFRNSLTGIARSEIFSTRNQRFAASYLRPGQRSTLTGRVLISGEKATIRFWSWEATRDLQLRVCCDDTKKEEQCVFQTDRGVKRGSRRWIEQTATCPQGTKKIIFECLNLGRFQGACGIDNIQLVNDYCPSFKPSIANR